MAFGRKKWQPTSVFLPEKFHGQKNLVAYSPRDLRVRRDGLHTRMASGVLVPRPELNPGPPSESREY